MNKKRAGVTLVELILAISLLTVATAPILSVMVSSFHTSAQAQQLKTANFAAQQVMEELIGREWNGQSIGDPSRFQPYLVHFNWGVAQQINISGRSFFFVATHNGYLGANHENDGYGRVLLTGSGGEQTPLLQVSVCIHETNPGQIGTGITTWSAAWAAVRTGGGRVSQSERPGGPLVSNTAIINTAPGGFVNP